MKLSYRDRRWFCILALLLGIFACNYPSSTSTPIVSPPLSFPSTSPVVPAPTASPAQNLASPSPLQTLPPSTFTPDAPLPTPTIAYQPTFEATPCAFPVPDGYGPDCGYLVVPENRSRPGSPLIRLHVAVFHSTSPNPAPDPVVHLAGGPGSSSLGVAGYLFRQGLGAILEQRDFILFDQRGTGYSLPRLDCPEREALTPILLEGGLSTGEADQAITDAFQRCRERLTAEGVDLTTYHSTASAADINDLLLALGYGQFNLYGVSYGTRLALTVMRDYPDVVRSAVLDSAYPLQVNLYTSLAPNAERAFNVLFDRCASDPDCSTAYPGLRSVFYELVDQLNADPAPVPLTAGGAERTVLLNGRLLVDVLFMGLYNRSVAATMPRMIFAIRQGDYTILQERLKLYYDTSSAVGMQMSVQCAEEIPFSQLEEVYAAAQGVPPQVAAVYLDSVQPLFEVCREWGLGSPDPREKEPVLSNLPALVLAGEYDPITPPDWGRMVAGDLPYSYFYEFPGNGHWVTRSSSCALEMALAFWENPAAAPDAACLQSNGALDYF